MGLRQDGDSGASKKWSSAGCIPTVSKVEATEFDDVSNVGCKRRPPNGVSGYVIN